MNMCVNSCLLDNNAKKTKRTFYFLTGMSAGEAAGRLARTDTWTENGNG